MKSEIREFKELGFIPATKTTDLYLSACFETGVFKGYYLSKKYTIKDSQDEGKYVKVFASGAYRLDTLENLKQLRDLLNDAIQKEESQN